MSQVSININDLEGDGFINAANAAAGITISGTCGDSILANVVGETVTVTLNGKSYTGIVESGGTWSVKVAAAELGALTNGHAYTVTASVTDAAGNKATASERVTVDETASLAIKPIDGDGFINAANAAAGITISGTCGDSILANVVGETVTVTLNGKSYTGTVGSGGTWSVKVAAAELGALTNGHAYTVTASVTDAAGNKATASERVTVDETASLAIKPIDGDGFINAANAAAGITISGTCGDSILANVVGETVTVTLNGKSYTGIVESGGTWSVKVAAAELGALTNGHAYTVTASVTDAAGNKATASERVTVDETATLSIKPIDGDGFINAANAAAGITISGTCGDSILANMVGETVTVTLNGKSYTGAVGRGGTWSVKVAAAELGALTNGHAYTVTASVTDAAGNKATASERVTVDETASLAIKPIDGDGFINAANAAAGITISGTCGDSILANVVGETVTVTLNGKSYTGTVGSGGTWSVKVAAAELGALTNGHAYTVTASVTDAAGNKATASERVTVDETATLSIKPIDGDGFINAANAAAGITISGTCGDSILANVVGETVTVTLNGKSYTGIVESGGTWSVKVAAAELGALTNGHAYTVTASVTDAAGNKATASERVTVDETASLAIKPIDGDGFINAANAAAGIAISGASTGGVGSGDFAGQTVSVLLDGKTYTTTIAANGTWSVTVGAGDVGALADGQTYNVTANATDNAGNTATTSASVITDETASLSISPVDGDNLINAANAISGITISGKCRDSILANVVGQAVTVTLNGKSYTGTVQSGGTWSVKVGAADLGALSDGQAYTVAASVTDAAGNNATATDRVTVVDAPSAATSTFAASPSTVTANGASTTTLTVTVEDAFGNRVAGAAVTLSATGSGNTFGTISGTTNANGVFTTTLASTLAQTETVTAAEGGVKETSSVTFVAGAPSAATSTLAASPSTVTADGASTTTLTVTVEDAFGNRVAGAAVTLSATGSGNTFGTISGTTNANGVFTTTLASTLAQTETVTAAEGGVKETSSVTFVAGAPSAATSTLAASPSTVTADGASTTTLTVTVEDAFGNRVAGAAVTLSATGSGNTFGTISGTTNANGVFTTTLASTLAQTETVTAAEGGVKETSSVTFVAGAPSATTSTLVASPGAVTADGVSTTTLTLTLEDADGNRLAGIAVTLSATGSDNDLTPASGVTNAEGVFVATLASPLAQTETVVATEEGAEETASVTFETGAPSGVTSTLVASPVTVTADGVSTTTLTLTVEDANGNAVAGIAVTLSANGSDNTFGAITGTTNANGVFTTTLASTAVQIETVTAKVGSIEETTNVVFVAGAPSAVTSSLVESSSTVNADGVATTTLTVTVEDAYGNPVAGTAVTLSANGSDNTFGSISGTTNARGVFTTTLASTLAQTETVTATEGSLQQSVSLTFATATGPDLVVMDIAAPTSAITGEPVEVSWTTENEGNATAIGPWDDNIYIASDAAGDNLQLIGTYTYDGSLAAGQSITASELVTLPSSVSGSPYFVIEADPTNQVGAPAFETDQIVVGTVATPVTMTIDWSSQETSTRPPSIDATDWNLIWDRFEDEVGTTTYKLNGVLAVAASDLTLLGDPVSVTSDDSVLIAYELEQASGVIPNITLADTTDLADNGTGLDLSLTRNYSASFLDRNNPGAFGDGWTFTYGVTAIADSSGNVYITSPSGTEVFTLNSDGSYSAQAGDTSTLALTNGAYVLTDSSGDVETFNAGGDLATITDSNGNVVTISYGGNGFITGVTSSNGQSLSFTTNAEGRITSATDGEGNVVRYSYDASGDHLLSVTGPNGTTSYTYSSSGDAYVANALTGITNPDGTQESFGYDSQGDLTSQSGGGGEGAITYSYPSVGKVTETDAAGNTTTLLYDENGDLAGTEDAEGNVTKLSYDSDGDLTGIVTPTGGVYTFAYDSEGNLSSYTDPSGGTVTATYEPGTTWLTSLTDQNGNTTDYSYNAAGDLTGITYDNGSGTSYQYSATGTLTSETNARGETTTYTYNPQGLLTKEAFSDGTFQAYGYNAMGELTSAQATNGAVTTYGYNAAGELTSVTNAAGQVESYTYNSYGQEASRTEPDGSRTLYTYNAAGQLAKLTDGSGNLITQYTYNALGQLVGSLDGNGQTTSYSYDADGNVTQIQTKAANGSVTSELDYAYDSDGRPVTVKSLDGTWTYSYDTNGELIHAVFASTNSSIANQDLKYEYDAAGNRTQTIFNGAVNNYTTNGLNQYTASDGTTYAYDADGNLIQMVQNGATTTYTYNSQNQLLSTTGPSGTTTYTYDALGNVVSTSVNGVISNYIIDPLAISTSATGPLSAIAQAYNAAGDVEATYEYGNGLTAEITGSDTYYYNADAGGNVTSLSGAGGALVQSYEYDPFGNPILTVGDVINQFQFSGLFGVATTTNGLIDMRARFYSSSFGRFLATDPAGIAGGINAYLYTDNNPITYIDPIGLTQSYPIHDWVRANLPKINNALLTVGKAEYDAYEWTIDHSSDFLSYILHLGIEAPEPSSTTTEILAPVVAMVLPPGEAISKDPYNITVGATWYIFNNPYDLAQQIMKALNPPIGAPGNSPGSNPPPLPSPTTPSGPVAKVSGCPHFATFDGLDFDFQGAGEFIAAKSTVAGDNFQVQMRIEPEGSSDSSVSIITQIAVQVGDDRVTFGVPQSGDASRPSLVMVDGAAVSISASNPVFTLKGGTVTEVSSDDFIVALNTGEQVTVNPFGDGMGLIIALAANEGPGSVQGFFGSDEGQGDDFMLPDGTVLQQPLTQDQLYQTFANAWRVTQDNSLLDYAPGQTTATFTNLQYPRQILTLADFPPELVAQAAALAAAAGITDPTLAADAEFDYISMGDPNYFAEDAEVAGYDPTPTTQAVITGHVAPASLIGVLDATPSVVEASGGVTAVTFDVNLTSAVSAATTVDYAVSPLPNGTAGDDYLQAADFGGVLPSGSVTIAAGQTVGQVTIDVPMSAIGAAPDKWLQLAINSPVDENLIYDSTARVEIINNEPVAGTPADPVFELIAPASPVVSENGSTLTHGGDDYTLNLGEIVSSEVLPDLQFALANMAAAPADSLMSEISNYSGTGFEVTGAQPPATLAAGAAYQDLYFQPETTTLGAQSETLTLSSEDVNDSGYAVALTNSTLTVEDIVVAPAQASVNTPTITFANVRAGTPESRTITVTNIAPSPAANLDVTLTANAGATASGMVTRLTPGASDGSDLSVGLDTTTAGSDTGTVTLNQLSDLGNGVEVPALPSPVINVAGAVYREATGQVAPSEAIVHVGASGTAKLVVSNVDPADGFSEGLRASLVSSSGGIAVSGGPTGLIAAGADDSTSLTLDFATGSAGTVTGHVTLDYVSDGAGTSGLTPIDLGDSAAPISIQVNNYARASIEDANGVGVVTNGADGPVIDLGTIARGAATPTVVLDILNSAIGPADSLSGDFSIAGDGDNAFSNAGLGAFSGLVAGGAGDTAPTIALNTDAVGSFEEQITVNPVGSNASGYSGALSSQTVTIEGAIAGAAPPVITIGAGNSDAATVTDTSSATELTASGTFSFSDAFTAYSHTVSVLPDEGDFGTLSAVVTQDTTGTGEGGVITWDYEVSEAVAAELAAGQSHTDVFAVTVSDGNGGIATQDVTVAIDGVNEPPVITIGPGDTASGAVTSNLAETTLTTSGMLSLGDPDLTDSHTVSVAAQAGDIGTLTAVVSQDSTGTGTGGVITWDYQVNEAAVAALGAGRTHFDTFTVSIDDGHGGVTTQTIDVSAIDTVSPFSAVWDNAEGGDWNSTSNWESGALPGSTDTVLIDLPSGATVTLDSGDDTVDAVALEGGGTLLIDGGTLTVTSQLGIVSGTLQLSSGGVIQGATITNNGGLVEFSGGTLSDVTYVGTLDLTPDDSFVYVTDGMTVKGANGSGPGAINLGGDYSGVIFEDTQIFDDATITLGGNYDSVSEYVSYAAYVAAGYTYTTQTLTLGAKLTIDQTSGYDFLGYNYYYGYGGGYGDDAIVNEGTINVEGGTLTIDPTSFGNSGSIDVSSGSLIFDGPSVDNAANGKITVGAGASLTFGDDSATATNEGTITATDATVTLYLNETGWNTGTLAISGSTANLYGSFTTAELAPLEGHGNTINIYGTLNNSGAKLATGPGDALTQVNLEYSGTIDGGTIADSGSGVVFQGGTLDDVIYDGTLDLTPDDSFVYVTDGLTAAGANGAGPGAINLGGYYSGVIFEDTQTFDDATITLGGNYDSVSEYVSYAAYVAAGYSYTTQTLTLGAKLTIDQTGAYGFLGYNYYYGYGGGYGDDAIVNEGTINVEGGTLTINPTSFGNNGSIDVSSGSLIFDGPSVDNAANGQITVAAGASLTFGDSSDTATNEGTITATDATVTLYLNETGWNTGTLAISDSTVNLYGAFTTAMLTPFEGEGNTINIHGTLDNGGSTLAVGSGVAITQVNLESSGVINGGTIEDSGSGVVFQGGTLDDVIYDGTLDLTPDDSFVYVTDGLTAAGANGSGPGAINLGGYYSGVIFEDTQTFDDATIMLGGNYDSVSEYVSYAAYVAAGYTYTTQTLTLGAKLTIDQTSGYDFLGYNYYYGYGGGYGDDAIVNEGTINVEGGTLTIDPTSFGNSGSIDVSSGSLIFDGPSVDNAANGKITVGAGASLTFGDDSATATNEGTITATDATVTLYLNETGWNTGTLAISGSTANLYGSFTTAELAPLEGHGNTINIYGTLNNSGAKLATGPGDALTQVNLEYSGTIDGGTIADSGSGVVFQGGTLDDVIYDGTLDLTPDDSFVYVTDGLTAAGANGAGPGAINLGGYYSGVIFEDTQTFDDATITLGGNYDSVSEYVSYAAYVAAGYSYTTQTLTLGAKLTIDQTGAYGFLGYNYYYGYGGGYGDDAIVNEGTINVEGGTLTINPTSFGNNGSIDVSSGSLIFDGPSVDNAANGQITVAAGASLTFGDSSDTATNEGTITATDATVTLYLNETGWNTGTLAISDSTVNLYGSFTTAELAPLEGHGNTINIYGTLDNSGAKLAADPGKAFAQVGPEADGDRGSPVADRSTVAKNAEIAGASGNDVVTIPSAPAERLTFTPGFGQEMICNFLAAGADHDILQFDASAFRAGLTAAHQNADLLMLLADTTQGAAGSAVISDRFGDSLTLTGITKSILSVAANAADFRFV